MVKETYERMSKGIQRQLDTFKTQYRNLPNKDETRARMAGYVLGLRDAGFITERERQVLFVYMT